MRLLTSASRRASLLTAVLSALAIAGPALSQQGARRFGFGPPMASDALAAQRQTRGAKGDQQRHYYFADAGQEMPYHLYVPQSYDPATPMPLACEIPREASSQSGLTIVGSLSFFGNHTR